MYKSPIQIMYDEFYKTVSDQLDHKIFQAVVNANITVDRDELLKALAYDRGQYDKGYDDGYQDGKRDAREWISVNERMPEEPGEYTVAYHPCYWDDVDLCVTKVGIDNFRGKTTWAKKKYQRVTHWRPLPEPPKEVEE